MPQGDQGDKAQPNAERRFPLDLARVPGGWAVTVYLAGGREWRLMRPGWQSERHTPYVFKTPEEAWDFVRRLFLFCIQQAHAQFVRTDKVMNCRQCGRIFRARFYCHCFECLQHNEDLLQQIWQGFYYMTGSRDDALHKLSMLLRLPPEQLARMPDAFGTMMRRNVALALEDALKPGGPQAAPQPEKPATPAIRRQPSSTRHAGKSYGLRGL